MRIPSQFNDETLYGRRGAVAAGGSFRRVIRLSVVLALVVVVMQQASQPEMYETFFGGGDQEELVMLPASAESSALETLDSVTQLAGKPADERQAAADAIPADAIDDETRLAASAITHAMQRNEQRQWTVILDRWQSGESFDLMRSVIPATWTTSVKPKD